MHKPLFCEKCNHERQYIIIDATIEYEVKRESFQIEGRQALCTICGSEVFHLEIEQENQQKAFNVYRQKYGLLDPNDIKNVREKYQLTQQEFSILLGFHSKTISRLERGSLPTLEQNHRIKKVESYSFMLELLKKNGAKLKNEVISRLETSCALACHKNKKETIIQFDDQTNLATLYTSSWTVAKIIRRAGFKPLRYTVDTWWFQIPVQLISLQNEHLTTKEEQEIWKDTMQDYVNIGW